MSDERLRLIADMKNNASPKLKQLGKDIREQVKLNPQMEGMSKWFKDFNKTSAGFTKAGAEISGTMGAIGIGGITAAASLGGLVAQLKALGDHTFAMKELGRETGLTMDQVHRWEFVGKNFHVPIEQMDSAISTLGDKMVLFRRHRGELFGQLNAVDPDFAKKLGMESTQKQLEDIPNWIAKSFKNPGDQKQWMQEFFGSGDVEKLLARGPEALNKTIADSQKYVSPITQADIDAANALTASVTNLGTAWENFERKIGPSVLAPITAELQAMTRAADDARSGALSWSKYNDEFKAAHPWLDVPGLAEKGWDWLKGQNAPAADSHAPPATKWPSPLPKAGDFGINPYGALDTKSFGLSPFGTLDTKAFSALGLQSSDTGKSDGPIATGTKYGVLAALREWNTEGSGSGGGDGLGGGGGSGGLGGGGGSGGGGNRFGIRRPYRGGAHSGSGGGAGGDGSDSSNVSPSGLINAGKAKTMSAYAAGLKASGLSDNAIAGIMGDVGGGEEKAWSASNRHFDQPKWRGSEAENAHGLNQLGGEEWNRYDSWIKKNHPGGDWRDPKLQGAFLGYDLKRFQPDVFSRLNNESPAQAAITLQRKFERGIPYDAASTAAANRYSKMLPNLLSGDAAKSIAKLLPPRDNVGSDSKLPYFMQHQPSNISNLLGEARKAGLAPDHRVHHTGGATIDIRGLPAHRGATVRTHGLIDKVNLQRAPTMTTPDYEA